MDCTVVMKENVEHHLSNISSVLGGNYLTLALCAGIILVAVYVSYIMVIQTISMLRSYYALLTPSTTTPARTSHNKNKTATSVDDDDAVYPDAVAAKALESNIQDSDNSRIKSSMSLLKARYAVYNSAMKDFAGRVQGRVADDLMDESILSRENDDFKYTKDHDTTNG